MAGASSSILGLPFPVQETLPSLPPASGFNFYVEEAVNSASLSRESDLQLGIHPMKEATTRTMSDESRGG
jgi:hypothetical protein